MFKGRRHMRNPCTSCSICCKSVTALKNSLLKHIKNATKEKSKNDNNNKKTNGPSYCQVWKDGLLNYNLQVLLFCYLYLDL